MKKLFFIILLNSYYQAAAQMVIDSKLSLVKPNQTHILRTIRADEFIGKTISFDSGIVVFKLKISVVLRFEFSKVRSIRVYKKPKKSKTDQPNQVSEDIANLTERNMASPTAFNLKRGEWQYSNQLFLFNNFNYGYRDNHTIGVGTFLRPGSLIGWANLKSSIRIKQHFHAAVGGLMAVGADQSNATSEYNKVFRAMMLYSALTYGTREKFINVLVGKAVSGIDDDSEFTPLLYSLGGAAKISPRTRVFVELGKITPDYTRFSANIGFSILGKKSNTSLGVLTLKDWERIPVFTYVRRLGRGI